MISLTGDILVLGSGFGGSLMALLLNQIGLRPIVIDRGSHPRFAIGESSTPVADYVLRDLATRYDLPQLAPFTQFGTWQATYPQIGCGRKRGFSYFRHEPGQPFRVRPDHGNELLVAASASDAHADTHWLRADVDAFFASQVQAAGIPFLDQTQATLSQDHQQWRLTGERLAERVQIQAPFVIDATGGAAGILAALNIPSSAAGLKTNSLAIYSHFANVRPWRQVLEAAGDSLDHHPFCADHAAQHHLLDEGWGWQLRFENQITSAGFALAADQLPHAAAESAEQQWNTVLQRYPSLARQFADASLAPSPGCFLQTGRLQRRAAQIAGANWALLPNTAGFIDPLHSTGIAQTLCGIERLANILGDHWRQSSLAEQLQQYEATLSQEFELIDQLVHGCYQARHNHRLFVAFSLLYFVAATNYEHRRQANPRQFDSAFLGADDPALRQMVDDASRRLHALISSPKISPDQLTQFEREMTVAIAPWNRVGLGDPSAGNMYRYTTAPR